MRSSHSLDRLDSAFDDDFVGLVVDTFNDERRAFEFFVNPLGIQMDLIRDDVSGREDSSWDTIWDSAGRLTDDGYRVELAVREPQPAACPSMLRASPAAPRRRSSGCCRLDPGAR